MVLRINYLALGAMCFLGACATPGPAYSISKQTEEDNQLASNGVQTYGHWTNDKELDVVVFTIVPSGSVLPTDSLKADVTGDVIHVHFEIMADKSSKGSDVATLCGESVKLNYRLHGIPHIAYRIQVDVTEFGDSGSRDIEPLVIR